MAVYLGAINNGSFITSDGYRLHDSNGVSLSATSTITKWNIVIDNIVYRANVNLSLKDGE